jgi:hypothetical protein
MLKSETHANQTKNKVHFCDASLKAVGGPKGPLEYNALGILFELHFA